MLSLRAAFKLLSASAIISCIHSNKVDYPPAEFCNPETLEGCKGRQAEFAERMRDEPLAWQMKLLDILKKRPRYEDEAEWIDDQIIILENVIEYTKATRGEL
jgi:hypothetical protein